MVDITSCETLRLSVPISISDWTLVRLATCYMCMSCPVSRLECGFKSIIIKVLPQLFYYSSLSKVRYIRQIVEIGLK